MLKMFLLIILIIAIPVQTSLASTEEAGGYSIFQSVDPLTEDQQLLLAHDSSLPLLLLNKASRIARVDMADLYTALVHNRKLNAGDKLMVELFEGFTAELVLEHIENTNFAVILGARTSTLTYNNLTAAITKNYANAVFYVPDLELYYFLIYDNDLISHYLFEVPVINIDNIILIPAVDDDSKVTEKFGTEEHSIEKKVQQVINQGFIETLEWQTFYLINSERANHNLQALKMDNKVREMARAHSKDMGDNNFFSHTSPTYGTFVQRLAAYNIVYFSAGENIAWNNYPESSSADFSVQMWMNSAGHRANILNENFIYTGIGVYQAGNGKYYYTQVFIGATHPPSFVISFPDVPPEHQFFSYIEAIYAAGITQGFSDGTYRPSESVSRGQMAAFIARALSLNTSNPPAVPSFPDVPTTNTFYKYIEAIYAAGITKGYNDGTYRPSEPVAREQMAAFIARALDLNTSNPPAVPSFPDVTEENVFFNYIEAIYAAGITQGYSDGTYRPGEFVTREQMAAFLARAFDLLD